MLDASTDPYVAKHWVLTHEEESKHSCRIERMKLVPEEEK